MYQQITEIRAVELRTALGFLEKRGEPVKVRNTSLRNAPADLDLHRNRDLIGTSSLESAGKNDKMTHKRLHRDISSRRNNRLGRV